jgi:hypothetical protein
VKSRTNPSFLYRVADPDVDQRIVLDLAVAIHRSRNGGSSSVSMAAQIEANDVFEKEGFEGALARLCALEDVG